MHLRRGKVNKKFEENLKGRGLEDYGFPFISFSTKWQATW
jgi:hypothetical protein